MKDLVSYVLRLLLQLVIFALTGRWLAFSRSTPESAPAPQRPRRRERRERRELPLPVPIRSWSYRDEGEAFTHDAAPSLEGGPVRRRSPRAAPRPAPMPAPPRRSLAHALRDRSVLRDALTLDAALGSRGRHR